MIVRLAMRSLATRPVRTAVLACGFGFGIAVMAALLGVGDVILEQSHSPLLQGGGDVVVSGRYGSLESGRFLLTGILGAPDVARRVAAASPSQRATLYLISDHGPAACPAATCGEGGHSGRTTAIPVAVKGGVPSLEKGVGDPEITDARAWIDRPADRAWSHPDLGDLIRTMDRFHRIPPTAEFAASWAEWLYFNGRTSDGRVRFYLTFMVGPASAPGRRAAGVRLQLDRDGVTTSYAAVDQLDEAKVLAEAPDLDIAGNRVRLEGLRYRLELALPGATGTLVLDAAPGQSLPPATIRGARGWLTGYTAPVLSGKVRGTLQVGRDRIELEDATGYHDHNWGFWRGVRWQWGQVAHDDLSILYGRVFPPADVADPDRIPGFLGVLSSTGVVGFSSTVSIGENGDSRDDRQPKRITVHARSLTMELNLEFAVDRSVRTPMSLMAPSSGAPTNFLQFGGEYRVTGHVGGRVLDFSARGAAETFR
jgi:hypothetical protein